VEAAELLLAKGAGRWEIGTFRAKAICKAPVLIECAGGVSGGYAAVPFQGGDGDSAAGCWTADPTGTSFVLSLRPTAGRYPLNGNEKALYLSHLSVHFGDGCLNVFVGGDMSRRERTYAVSSGWDTVDFLKFTRFEVWRVAL
jgi:hypothetical protein